MFASFMEESNIRWGELVGGLLIIGCSVALVVSFWGSIAQKPWLQFSVFTAVTAWFFAIGLYTEHRWRLPTTSRGILLIATLLVPLNFLAFAAFSAGRWPGMVTLAAEGIAFALFVYLLLQAARVIARIWPALFTAGVSALSATLILLGCVDVGPVGGGRFLLLAYVPIGFYLAPVGLMLGRARRWRPLHAHGGHAILLLLGVVSFSTALALALLTHRSGDTLAAVHRLAFALSLCGLPPLACGMLLWRRLAGRGLGSLRTAGTAVAVVGAAALLAGIADAWPDPARMLPIALGDFVALAAIAIVYDLPAAHWLALPCAVFSWLVAFHFARGTINSTTSGEQMLEALASTRSGAALMPMAFILYGGWELLTRVRRGIDAAIHAAVGLAVAGASLALLTWGGFGRSGDPFGATYIYALYAAAAFALAWRCNRSVFGWIGWMLLTASLLQGFISHDWVADPWPVALLAAAAIAALFIVLCGHRDSASRRLFARPAYWLSQLAPFAAVAIALVGISYPTMGRASAIVGSAALIYFIVAVFYDGVVLFLIGKFLLAGAILLAVLARLATHGWFARSSLPLLDAWTLQTAAVALAAACLFWRILGLVISTLTGGGPQRPPMRLVPRLNLLLGWTTAFDFVVAGLLLAILLALAGCSVTPAIVAEFPNTESYFGQWTLAHAGGVGSWALLGFLALFFGLTAFNWGESVSLAAFVLTLWAACPLLSSRQLGNLAGGSSLRWTCAAYYLGGSVLLWAFRFFDSGESARLGKRPDRSALARAMLLLLAGVPILILTVWPVIFTFADVPVAGPVANSFFGKMGLTVSCVIPALAVSLTLLANAISLRSPRYAFSTSAAFCYTATLGYLLALATARQPLEIGSIIRVFQINALILAGFALAWRGVMRIPGVPPTAGPIPRLLKAQVVVALALNAIIIIPASIRLALWPPGAMTALAPAGDLWGWAALVAAMGAALGAGIVQRERMTFTAIGRAAVILAAMAGLTVAWLFPSQGWRAFHAMLASDVLGLWALLALGGWIVQRAQNRHDFPDRCGRHAERRVAGSGAGIPDRPAQRRSTAGFFGRPIGSARRRWLGVQDRDHHHRVGGSRPFGRSGGAVVVGGGGAVHVVCVHRGRVLESTARIPMAGGDVSELCRRGLVPVWRMERERFGPGFPGHAGGCRRHSGHRVAGAGTSDIS